jgi:hypothetical protein
MTQNPSAELERIRSRMPTYTDTGVVILPGDTVFLWGPKGKATTILVRGIWNYIRTEDPIVLIKGGVLVLGPYYANDPNPIGPAERSEP